MSAQEQSGPGDRIRRLLVTGGSSGLGASVVSLALARGFRVAVLDRRATEATAFFEADLSDTAQTAEATAAALSSLGGLDALVLCAGVNRPGTFEESDAATMEFVMRVNLVGNAQVARIALPELVANRGHLVTIGSTHGRRGFANQSAYCASKFAVAGWMQCLAIELRGRVAVSTVMPGGMRTGFFDDRPQELVPDPAVLLDPGTVARGVLFCLEQPPQAAIRELVMTDVAATDWP
jgi:2-dehydro-3-deoxy-L-rhamnonate dehydrogenase (NAD+)